MSDLRRPATPRNRRGRWRLAGTAAAALLALPAWGAPGTPDPLSLRGALLLALERSPQLEVERRNVAAAGTRPEEERAVFDPQLALSARHLWARQQTTARQSALETATEDVRRGTVDEFSGEVTRQFQTGTGVTVSADTNRNDSNLSLKQFSGRAGLRVDQALLRGRDPDANLARVRIAENNVEISRYQLLAAIQDLLAGVESTYWDLAFARAQVAVRRDALDTARQLMAEAQARVEAGKLPRVELAAARAEVAAREEALEDARGTAEEARLELLRWLVPGDAAAWAADPRLADEPIPPELVPDTEVAVGLALGRRPDLLQARLELANGELEIVETRDGLLPKLDLFGTYAHTGLGTDLGDAWDTVLTERYREWSIGATFAMALGRRAERARAARAEVSRSGAEAAVHNLELLVQVQVRRAAVAVARLLRKADLARATSAAREEEVAAEKARFEAGRSTSSDVLQAENRLSEARLGWQRARADGRKAWAELARLQGVLVDLWEVEVR